jgi:hypothetical protein
MLRVPAQRRISAKVHRLRRGALHFPLYENGRGLFKALADSRAAAGGRVLPMTQLQAPRYRQRLQPREHGRLEWLDCAMRVSLSGDLARDRCTGIREPAALADPVVPCLGTVAEQTRGCEQQDGRPPVRSKLHAAVRSGAVSILPRRVPAHENGKPTTQLQGLLPGSFRQPALCLFFDPSDPVIWARIGKLPCQCRKDVRCGWGCSVVGRSSLSW